MNMTINQRILLASVCLVSSFFAAIGAAAPNAQASADEVVEKYLAALGGRDALSKITSQRATGTMTVAVPGGELSGPVELLSKAPNKMRMYLQLDLSPMGMNDKMTLEQKFDGTTGWMLDSMQGDRQITGNQLENMKNAFFPSPLLNYKANGAKLELAPSEAVNGKKAVVLLFTPVSGSPVRIYFDAETYLIMRTKTTVNTDDQGPVEQIRDPSDYRTVNGVKWPFQSINQNAVQTLTLKLEKMEMNVPIDDAVFRAK